MLAEENVRALKYSVVFYHGGVLNKEILALPVQIEALQIRHRNCISPERTFAVPAFFFYSAHICLIRDDALERDPFFVMEDFHPGVDDPVRRKDGNQSGGGPFLKILAHRRAVQSAGDTDRPEKRHKQGAFRVALSVTVLQDFLSGKQIGTVVSEQHLIPRKIIHRADPLVLLQLPPPPRFHEVLNALRTVVQHPRFLQKLIFHNRSLPFSL